MSRVQVLRSSKGMACKGNFLCASLLSIRQEFQERLRVRFIWAAALVQSAHYLENVAPILHLIAICTFP
jgi:hypothetical protein